MREELMKYGLSAKEADVYLACIKSGDVSANRISELSGIRRSTVYEVIESLKKKGLVKSFSKDKKLYFSAVEPTALIDLLKDKERLIQSILPDIERIRSQIIEKPRIELFEGTIGIKNALKEMLKQKEILVYGASIVGDRVLGAYTANFAMKRAEKGIMMKAIIEKTIPKHMMERDVAKFTQIKTLDFLKEHNSAYFIYDNKLILVTLGEELIAIKITSPLLVKSQKEIFNFLWKIAKS